MLSNNMWDLKSNVACIIGGGANKKVMRVKVTREVKNENGQAKIKQKKTNTFTIIASYLVCLKAIKINTKHIHGRYGRF